MKHVLLAGLVSLGMLSTAQAGPIIFDNGTFGTGGGLFADTYSVAGDFSLEPGSTLVADVHWWGTYAGNGQNPAPVDNFLIEIYEDSGGLPTASPLVSYNVGSVGRINTSVIDFFGDDIYEYWVDIPETPLASNTTYWLRIGNSALNWVWKPSTGGTGLNYYALDSGSGWRNAGIFELAFNLTTTAVVPEPSTFALLSIGGVALVGYGWRRKRQQAA